ncbi:MAG: hypothetical protein WBQ68_02495 [Terriglobales bacterium]
MKRSEVLSLNPTRTLTLWLRMIAEEICEKSWTPLEILGFVIIRIPRAEGSRVIIAELSTYVLAIT